MSVKRSRETYEADLQAQQSPFVLFGTPLPLQDSEVRDDGSYVPVWKQEVRDERGRKRLHGAFTGGWSAGYFNTVGSKEGWAPSTFVSSRTSRWKKDSSPAQQRPEDFMDDEDLADAEEGRKIQTSQAFAGLGLTENDGVRSGGLAGLFRVEGETMGTKLLKKMGWREGQGIGPRIRRPARLDVGHLTDQDATHVFAPDNVVMISFVRKTDRMGLGYDGQDRLTPLDQFGKEERAGMSDEEEEQDFRKPAKTLSFVSKSKKEKRNRGGIGIGILNDTGSDEEDPYEIGPRISYNRVVGGDKKKKKDSDTSGSTTANPSLQSKPVFISKKAALGKTGSGLRKCHNGRPPMNGFVFGQKEDNLTSEIASDAKYPSPKIPPEWKSSKQPPEKVDSASYVSTADAAKLSKLDPKSRAAVLGEKQLPGKSVFDFISPAARDRLAAATGKTDLPAARGEIPAAYAMSEKEKVQQLLKEVPELEKETATAAIQRAAGGGGPYGDDASKRSRYRAYLENQAGFGSPLPIKPANLSNDDWLREFHEFYNCARIFKPMTGFMASRFITASSSKLSSGKDGLGEEKNLVTKPAPKPKDAAEEAAKMGMFGHMTRSVHEFFPTRLLCKRLNVKPPANVQPDGKEDYEQQASSKSAASYPESGMDRQAAQYLEYAALGGPETASSLPHASKTGGGTGHPRVAVAGGNSISGEPVIDASRNEAIESKRAGEEVFRAIFGDSSDEDN